MKVAELLIFFLYAQFIAEGAFAPFIRDGQVHRTAAVVSFKFAFDQAELERRCQDLILIAGNFTRSDTKYYYNQDLRDLQKDVQVHCGLGIFQHTHHPLQKRQAFIAAAAGALVGFFTHSLFPHPTVSVETLRHNFATLDKQIERLQGAAAGTIIRIGMLEETMHKDAMLNRFHAKVVRSHGIMLSATRGLSLLLQGSLTSDIMSFSEIQNLYGKLFAEARRLNLKVPFHDPLLLYTLPVVLESFENGVYRFSLNVPLTSASYERWRFAESPLLVSSSEVAEPHNSVFLRPVLDYTHIVYSPHDGATSAIADGDLAQCGVWQGQHFCSHLVSFLQARTCVTTLFHEPTAAMDHCDFHFHTMHEFHITHLSPSTVLISLNVSSLPYEHVCPNGTVQGSLSYGQTRFSLGPGCGLLTSRFLIPALTTVNHGFKLREFEISPKGFSCQDLHVMKSSNPYLSVLQHQALIPLGQSPHIPVIYSALAIVVLLTFSAFCVLRFIFSARSNNPVIVKHARRRSLP